MRLSTSERRRRLILHRERYPATATLVSSFISSSFYRGLMMPEASTIFRRVLTFVLFVAAFFLSCLLIYRDVDPVRIRLPSSFGPSAFLLPSVDLNYSQDSAEVSLERILKDASMPDKTVILTTLNEAWAAPNCVFDLFLESFRIGDHTSRLLNHLVIIALDQKAFSRCLDVHSHCYALITEGIDLSQEAYFMTSDYLTMMWRRIDFLRSVLEMGYNFIFTDADVMWFRDPFPHFHPTADFQIACDYYSGNSSDAASNIPNGGFNFVRSNDRSVEFYKFWYSSRERYPGLHDQDVLNKIKCDSFTIDIGLELRFMSTAYFGGFCEPSKDLNQVCTMHANCCFGLESKVHDLRIMIQDWKKFMALPPSLKKSLMSLWRVPQKCSLASLRHHRPPENRTRVGR